MNTSGIDNEPPTIVNATVIYVFGFVPYILVVFNENVDIGDPSVVSWQVSGDDVKRRAGIIHNSDPSGTSNTMRLDFNIDSPIRGTNPENTNLTYTAPDSRGWQDTGRRREPPRDPERGGLGRHDPHVP